MPIIVAHPNVWTLLGVGPVRIYPKSWRIGVIVSALAPSPTAEPEDVVQSNCGQDYNVTLPVYAKPLDGDITSIGTIPLALASGGLAAAVPFNTSLPRLVGETYVGSVITADLGTWSNSPISYTYQFLRNNVPILGALGTATSTTLTYTTTSADSGANLSIQVVGANAVGSGLPATSEEIRIRADDFGVAMLFLPLVA